MKPIELEVKTFKGEKMTAVIELPDGTTSKKTLEVASELLTICKHWKQVRVGIGSRWSKWIKPTTQTNTAIKWQHNSTTSSDRP